MASDAALSSARSVFRLTLKTVAKRLPGNKPWLQYIGSLFRRPVDQQQHQAGLQLANDYCLLVNNIHHHKDLLKQYNIGISDDERTKQMVEAVARRIGFKLPPQQPIQSSTPTTGQEARQ